MTNLTLDTKEQVFETAISGLSRVAEAILATPNEARTKALDAAADKRQILRDCQRDRCTS